MKAKAPEKLFITNDEKCFSDKCYSASTEKYIEDDIEYTRTDVFVKKMKEVDLDKEIKSYFKGFGKFASVGIDDCIDIAKHFFELGLNASNPLTWEDIKIIGKLRLKVALDLRNKELESSTNNPIKFTEDDLCKEVFKRFKAQKGE